MIKLIKVEANANNNKFYNMTPDGDYFLAEWGRVGGHTSSKKYPIRLMERKRQEKLKKGYEDISHLSVVGSSGEIIVDASVRDLFHLLTSASKDSVSHNYVAGSEGVTQAMIDEAQSLLNFLTNKPTSRHEIKAFNDTLVKLFQVIPRKMYKVSDYLYDNNHSEIITREQDSLDALAGQVSTHIQGSKTLEEVYGISFASITSADEREINMRLRDFKGKVDKAWVVRNPRTEENFVQHVRAASDKKSDLLWHGSRNENWLSIVSKGLMIRPTNAVHTGSMFGDGLYFADKDRKSANYTSLRGSYWAHGSSNYGLLALYDVHQGRQKEILHHRSEHYSLSKRNLHPYDSVFAKGGADLINNEYIIYDGAQCNVRYLIKIS